MTLTTVLEKRCTGRCQQLLPLSAFGPAGSNRHQARCRECQAADARDRRAARPGARERAQLRAALVDLAASGLKRCGNPSCLRILPVGEFYRDNRRPGGRYNYCKHCCVQVDAARRPRLPWHPPTYSTVHQRLPSLENGTCQHCDDHAEEWAYDHGDPEELTDEAGRPYSLDQGHYMPLCRKCHRRYDMDYRKETGTARPRGFPRRTKPCTFCGTGFWNASHHRKTCSAACESALRSKSQSAYQERLRGRIARKLAAISGLGEPRLRRAREGDFSGPVSEGKGGQR
jgi:hypothetical protein